MAEEDPNPNPNPDPNPDPNPNPEPSGGIGTGVKPAGDDPAPQPADFASESLYQEFRASLPEELRDKDMFKNTKSLQSLAEQAINAQSALGKKRLPVPQDDWTDDDWGNFYNQLRPETVDAYEAQEKIELQLEGGEDAKEYTFDEETTSKLKETAHSLGLTNKQFQGLQKAWAENALGAEGNLDSQIQGHVQELTNQLRKDWGDDYTINHKSANEAYEAIVSQVPELEELINWSPVVANHPAVMKLFHTLAPMVQDMGIPSSGSGSGFGNDTVAGLKSQIQQFDAEHRDILFAPEKTLASMSVADKAKREKLLAQRTQMYQKLYS